MTRYPNRPQWCLLAFLCLAVATYLSKRKGTSNLEVAPAPTSDTKRERLYQQYLERRKVYADGGAVAASAFDSLVPILATGLLGFSLTYLEKQVPGSLGAQRPLLLVSWILLGASLAVSLIGRLLSQYVFAGFQKAIDEQWSQGRYPSAIKKGPTFQAVACANWITLTCLLAGTSTLIAFCSTCLKK